MPLQGIRFCWTHRWLHCLKNSRKRQVSLSNLMKICRLVQFELKAKAAMKHISVKIPKEAQYDPLKKQRKSIKVVAIVVVVVVVFVVVIVVKTSLAFNWCSLLHW